MSSDTVRTIVLVSQFPLLWPCEPGTLAARLSPWNDSDAARVELLDRLALWQSSSPDRAALVVCSGSRAPALFAVTPLPSRPASRARSAQSTSRPTRASAAAAAAAEQSASSAPLTVVCVGTALGRAEAWPCARHAMVRIPPLLAHPTSPSDRSYPVDPACVPLQCRAAAPRGRSRSWRCAERRTPSTRSPMPCRMAAARPTPA
jgi:hypothetical protein